MKDIGKKFKSQNERLRCFILKAFRQIELEKLVTLLIQYFFKVFFGTFLIQVGCCGRCVRSYLVRPDEGLDGQVILHQLLHIWLSPNQRGELRSNEARRRRQTQRRLIRSTRGSAGVGVAEKHIPRLEKGGRINRLINNSNL